MVSLEEVEAAPPRQDPSSCGSPQDASGNTAASSSDSKGVTDQQHQSRISAQDQPSAKQKGQKNDDDGQSHDVSTSFDSSAQESRHVREFSSADGGSASAAADENFHDAQERVGDGNGEGVGINGSKAGPEGDQEEVRKEEDDEEFKDSMTEDELRKAAIAEADEIKGQGNAAYGLKDYVKAIQLYAAALDICPVHEDTVDLRAACHANKAICLLSVDEYGNAVKSSSAALELKPDYLKAMIRRAQAYEKLDKLEEALSDYKKAVELDSSSQLAQAAVRRLEPIVEERREKLKEEMLGKLKDLGNTLLGNFGLSMDNFKAVKDPKTGSYSINFQS